MTLKSLLKVGDNMTTYRITQKKSQMLGYKSQPQMLGIPFFVSNLIHVMIFIEIYSLITFMAINHEFAITTFESYKN